MIWIFWILNFLAVILPQRIFSLGTVLIGFTLYCLSYLGVLRRGRLCVIKNLKQAGISSCGLASFVNSARYLGEFITMFRLNRKNFNQWIELIRIDRLETEYKRGKGVIVITAHLGNWELGGAALSKGYPTSVVSLHYMSGAVADFYEQKRKKKGLKVIYIEEVKKMVKVLREGQILAILGDRVYSGEGVEVKFFGKTAKFPLGTFWLALKTQASIVPAFAVHEKGRLKVCFKKPIFVRNKGEVMKGLLEYVSINERYIRQYPNEWCAYNSVWEA